AQGFFITNFNPRECFVMGGGFSPSGNMMDFTGVENLNFNRMNSYIIYGVEDILDGLTGPIRSLDDPRIKRVAPSENMQFTGGFSFDESLVFFHEDVNHAFDAMWHTNISNCDFDIMYANALPGEPGMPTQIHVPGNQMFLQPSPEGNRVCYSNFDGDKKELRVISFDIEADMDMDLGGVLIDNSGTNLIVPPGTLEENFSVKISTPFTIKDEAEISEGESTFFSMRLIDAEGLENPQFIEPMTLTIRYTDEEVYGLDEGMLEIYYYDESDPGHPAWIPLGGTVDPVHNEITVEIQHFSKFSIGGKIVDESAVFKKTGSDLAQYNRPYPEEITLSITVEEGVGFGDIVLGSPETSMEFIISKMGKPDRQTEHGLVYKTRFAMDFWMEGIKGPVREIRLNRGFGGTLASNISMASTMGEVFKVYGAPVAEQSVDDIYSCWDNRTLYRKEKSSKIFYNEKGLLFWFAEDQIIQIVVFKKRGDG
ncbi:MAG: hypothetical protein MUP44_06415, partial [Anaerolineales bacterium]|nr:hypothetical protein [Anaerolineales bacterium]